MSRVVVFTSLISCRMLVIVVSLFFVQLLEWLVYTWKLKVMVHGCELKIEPTFVVKLFKLLKLGL